MSRKKNKNKTADNKNNEKNVDRLKSLNPVSSSLSSDSLENSSNLDSDFPEISYGSKVNNKVDNVYREAKIDFSKLSVNETIGNLKEEALLIEEENLASESPLDRYVREHRKEVEAVKIGFGKEIDQLVNKEKKLLSSEKVEETFSEKKSLNLTEKKSESESIKDNLEILSDSSFDEKSLYAENESNLDEIGHVADFELDSESEYEEGSEVEGSNTKLSNDRILDPVEIVDDFKDEEAHRLEDTGFAHAEMVDTSIFPSPTFKELDEESEKTNQQLDSLEINSESEIPEKIVSTFNSRSSRQKPDLFSDEELVFPSSESVDFEDKQLSSEVVQENKAQVPNDESSKPKHRKAVIGLVTFAFLVVVGAIAGAVVNNNHNGTVKALSSASSSSSSLAASKKLINFNKLYDSFFTDANKTALKNSNFDLLTNLKKDLDVFPRSNLNYASLKAKYDDLSSNINAINTVNAIFDKAVIVDGKIISTATLTTGATIPSVSSKNVTINTVLKDAIKLAKLQEAQRVQKSSASSSSVSENSVISSNASTSTVNSSAGSTSIVTSTESGNYSQNPNGIKVNNSGSRIPIQNVDPNAPAFAWLAGYLNNVISQIQSRGYISGNNYILLPVAIDKAGEGWYNIYRPDGSYLFSINCKTGLWAGNGTAHPDLGGATF